MAKLNDWLKDGTRRLLPAYLYATYDDGARCPFDLCLAGPCKARAEGRDIFVYDGYDTLLVHGVAIGARFVTKQRKNYILIRDLARRFALDAFDPFGWDAFALEFWDADQPT